MAAVAATLLAGCAHDRLRLGKGEEGEVIEAEGWSPIDAQDEIGTKQRALAEAQKKAVERVVGVFISAKTRVDQAVNVDSRILANIKGYIRKYDVVKERKEAGFHKTTIRALVLYRKIGEDLKELGLVRPPPPPGNPRVAVRIQAKSKEKAAAAEAAAHGVRRGLLERGFQVVDEDEKENKADVLVTGDAEAYPIEDARLAGFRSMRARVTVKATKAGGQVMSHKTQEASGLDPSAEVAEGKAYDSAGALAGEALANELNSLLKGRVNVTVRVLGLKDLGEAQRFIDDLRNNPGIDAVTLSTYGEGRAVLDVMTEDVAGEELAAIILRMKKYDLLAKSVSAYEVEVEGR
ncbi:MAG: hypothetical protein HY553_08095 [Elusimicrobia bacterium]|nr:hypothetical protein [Elusimicrobiota bacterium]